MSRDLSSFESQITNYSNSIGIVWDQNQYDAFVSMAYNSGRNYKYVVKAIAEGKNPHGEFSKYIYASGQKSLGLYRRRIFVYGTYNRTYRDW